MKLRIGDIVELKTSKGFMYGIYTHEHKDYLSLVRFFNHYFSEAPDSIEMLAESDVRFSFFYPLKRAVKEGLVDIVGNIEVPDLLKPFPIFRAGIVNPRDKNDIHWWLWDGEKEQKIGKLSPGQRKYPIRGVMSHAGLIEELETNNSQEDINF